MAKYKKITTEMPLRVIYPRLLKYTWQHKRWLIYAGLGMLLASGGDVLLVYLVKPLLDGSIVNRDPFLIRWIPFFIIGIFAVRGVGGFVGRYCMEWASTRVVFDLRNDLFCQYLKLPVQFFNKHSTGNTTAKLTFYTEQVADAATKALKTILEDGIHVIGFLGLMFYLNWTLTLVTLIVAPLIVVFLSYISKKFRRYSDRIQRTIGDITQISEEVLTGQRSVKVFGGEDSENQRFLKANDYHRRMTMRKVATKAGSVPLIQIVSSFAVALVVGMALHGTGDGVMTPGELGSFFGAMMSLTGPIKRLTAINEQIQTGMAAAGAIFEVLDEPNEPDLGTQALPRARGEVQFKDLNFAYPETDKTVLKHINLDIPAGQSVAFVGRSGSGKSTLLSLLPRFYDYQDGEILLDQQPLLDYKLADLRRQIALVDQNIVLFNDTIANNIAYGHMRGASREDIERAAKLAYAHEFIQRLPNGYDTQVGQNGILLSGGQRQRIAIARAILKDAPILILDEATSALDTESEKAIQKGLENLMRDRTTLVIAHRLSTIRDVDKIVVLHDGELVEQGSHAELLAHGGHYRHLHDLQLNKTDQDEAS